MRINTNLRNGVSGIMRVKNDAEFIEASIDSCLDALDELIIVYNDCSDNSPELIYQKQKQYPKKIKVYEYKHIVYSINLTKEKYEFAKSLSDDSPHLLCNYYNFALSKVTYKYALKIDADQIYFTEKLREWCDIYKFGCQISTLTKYIGKTAWIYFRILNKINCKKDKIHSLLPQSFTRKLYPYYIGYVKNLVSANKVNISLSGLNIIYNGQWCVTLGRKENITNILPPYNGVGDHLIFKVTNEVHYISDDCEFYNRLRSDNYSLIERFVCKERSYNAGVFWFHLNAMRNNVKEKVRKATTENPRTVMPLEEFAKSDFTKDIEPRIDKSMMLTYQRSMFQFIHQGEANLLISQTKYLKNIKY